MLSSVFFFLPGSFLGLGRGTYFRKLNTNSNSSAIFSYCADISCMDPLYYVYANCI
uniref:Uncharacterized protein n=1 Tax=Setaria viridis TaxID=4556 RepID=A0A4U6TGV9_SETVI|nr:hypothetical protein SEVIR_8G190450v2 [Setaria viridis]